MSDVADTPLDQKQSASSSSRIHSVQGLVRDASCSSAWSEASNAAPRSEDDCSNISNSHLQCSTPQYQDAGLMKRARSASALPVVGESLKKVKLSDELSGVSNHEKPPSPRKNETAEGPVTAPAETTYSFNGDQHQQQRASHLNKNQESLFSFYPHTNSVESHERKNSKSKAQSSVESIAVADRCTLASAPAHLRLFRYHRALSAFVPPELGEAPKSSTSNHNQSPRAPPRPDDDVTSSIKRLREEFLSPSKASLEEAAQDIRNRINTYPASTTGLDTSTLKELHALALNERRWVWEVVGRYQPAITYDEKVKILDPIVLGSQRVEKRFGTAVQRRIDREINGKSYDS
ncbi:unnamed protein product [Amoebophrya sp. A25]|nr:unnamed protein product [Amoebophrya sp. A25]|eukprot:GSA25T00024995001.1